MNTPTSTTIISSVRMDGEVVYTTFSGALNGERFKYYLQNFLVPTLKAGDIVVLDNSKAHKVADVKQLIEAIGATILYLPPYSPDLNPIEMMWSKLKAIFRAMKARSLHNLLNAIPIAFKSVSVADIFGWFTKSGYSHSFL